MNRGLACLALFVLSAMGLSCAQSMAAVDRSMYGRIYWPGGREKPRIMYLWSMSRVRGAGQGAASRVMFGEIAHEGGNGDPDFMDKPHGVFLDADGRLMITDSVAGRVIVVNMSSLQSFTFNSCGEVDMLTPISVVSGPDGRIYVSDAALGKVGMYEYDGRFMKFFDGVFKRPTGLAIDPARNVIYVSDTWDHIIYMYNIDGVKLGSIGKRGGDEGEFNYPTHIAVGRDGTLYVSDTLNYRVQFFTPEGDYMGSFGVPGESYNAFDKIKGIAVDGEGHIYVTDSVGDMVKIFDREGNLLLFFGKQGSFYGDLAHPAGIFIDDMERIYVADSLNRRVQAFKFLGGE